MSTTNLTFVTIRGVKFAIGAASQLGLIVQDRAPSTTQGVIESFRGTLLAAVDGPMFEYASNETQRDYARYQSGRIRFSHYYPARGIDRPSTETSSGVSIVVVDGRARGEVGAGTRQRGETFRVQCYPSLVVNGRKTDGLRDVDNNKRPAMGILSDGRVFLALGTYISMPELADVLATANLGTQEAPVRVVWAGYLDGGGSAAMYVDIDGDRTAEYSFGTNSRRVISWVTLEKKTPLSEARDEAVGFVKRAVALNTSDPVPFLALALAAVTAAAIITLLVWNQGEPTNG